MLLESKIHPWNYYKVFIHSFTHIHHYQTPLSSYSPPRMYILSLKPLAIWLPQTQASYRMANKSIASSDIQMDVPDDHQPPK